MFTLVVHNQNLLTPYQMAHILRNRIVPTCHFCILTRKTIGHLKSRCPNLLPDIPKWMMKNSRTDTDKGTKVGCYNPKPWLNFIRKILMRQIIDESRGLLEEEKWNSRSKDQSGLLYIDSMILKSNQKD